MCIKNYGAIYATLKLKISFTVFNNTKSSKQMLSANKWFDVIQYVTWSWLPVGFSQIFGADQI